jgi:RNA binding exosome subunit
VPRRYHELRFSFFVQATEDEEKVLQAVSNVIGMEPLGGVHRSIAEGVHHNPILLLSVDLKKEKEIKTILKRLEGMDFWQDAKKKIEDRLDEDLVYHVRIDKEKAYRGEFELWTGGESIDVRLKVATYPSSREGSMNIILEGP